MVIHELETTPPPELQRALEEFESTFLAPFAPGRFFRVQYGSDRTAFCRALGEGRCLAAEKNGRIVGVLEMALVDLLLPSGATHPAVYIASIKMLPEERGTISTARLLQKGTAWVTTKSDLRFTVVLDDTPVMPPAYTGRAGIPALSEAGRMMLVRLPLPPGEGMLREDGPFLASREAGEELCRRLARGRYALLGGTPEARSVSPPVWLAHPSGLACGRFEDRRKVKRLIAEDGGELRPAYLSCFAFQDPTAAVDLIVAALRRAKSLRFGALRFCLPPDDLALLQGLMGPGTIEGSGGTIFVGGVSAGAPWNINAADT